MLWDFFDNMKKVKNYLVIVEELLREKVDSLNSRNILGHLPEITKFMSLYIKINDLIYKFSKESISERVLNKQDKIIIEKFLNKK